MAKQEVKIQKTVYRGNVLDRVVDAAFSTYVTQSPLDEVDTDTVEELFRLYDILAFQIPA